MLTFTKKPKTLTLTRKPGEFFILQDEEGNFLAEITVAERRGNNVRLSVKAPGEIKIIRSELLPTPDLHDDSYNRDEN